MNLSQEWFNLSAPPVRYTTLEPKIPGSTIPPLPLNILWVHAADCQEFRVQLQSKNPEVTTTANLYQKIAHNAVL